jgi:PPM family protein phosphatase
VNLRVGVRTDVGKVRDGNEDSYLVEEPLFVVADGMGGHLAGDVASATAVEVITQRAGDASVQQPESLSTLVRQANRAIYQKARSDPSLKGMGTTCTLVLIDGDRAQIAHVGDSRAYLLRGGRLEQLTEDHTLVGRMVKEGRLRQEEAQHHPQRSIITRALGVDADVDVDLKPVELHVGDRLLLNSDGLTSMIEDGALEQILAGEPDPQSAADKLVDAANDAGGEDNITVVVIDVVEGAAAGGTGEAVLAEEPAATVSREDTEPAVAGGSSTKLRTRFVIALIVVLVLAGGGYAAARYFVNNAWYVGANESGYVAVYRGIPEEIAGLDLKTEWETTKVAVADLPESTRENVEEGIKVDSHDEAESTVANLESLAEEFHRSDDAGGGSSGVVGNEAPGSVPSPKHKKRRNF